LRITQRQIGHYFTYTRLMEGIVPLQHKGHIKLIKVNTLLTFFITYIRYGGKPIPQKNEKIGYPKELVFSPLQKAENNKPTSKNSIVDPDPYVFGPFEFVCLYFCGSTSVVDP